MAAIWKSYLHFRIVLVVGSFAYDDDCHICMITFRVMSEYGGEVCLKCDNDCDRSAQTVSLVSNENCVRNWMHLVLRRRLSSDST